MKENRSFAKKLGWFFSILLLIILIPYFIVSCILAYGKVTNLESLPTIFEYRLVIIKDNAMKKDLYRDDLLIIKKQETYSLLGRGDIVTYKKDNDGYETRRIETIVSRPRTSSSNEEVSALAPAEYRLKASNRDKADSTSIMSNSIQGVYLFRIPQVGAFLSYINNGWLLVGSVPLLFIVIIGLIFLASKCEKKKAPVDKENKELELMSAAELTTGKNLREELINNQQQNAPTVVTPQPQVTHQEQNIQQQHRQVQVVMPPSGTMAGQIAGGIQIVPPSETTTSQTVQSSPVVQTVPASPQVVVVQPVAGQNIQQQHGQVQVVPINQATVQQSSQQVASPGQQGPTIVPVNNNQTPNQ